MFLFAQILGVAAMCIHLCSFQMKAQKTLIRFQMLSSLVFTVHYIFLGAVTGWLLNGIGIARAFVFSNKEKAWARKKCWLYLFIVGYFAVYVITFRILNRELIARNIVLEFIPVVGMVASTIGFYMEKASTVRKLGLINSPAWLLYNVCNHSIGGSITEICSLISIFVGMLRLDIKYKERCGR